jgi:hypothetical protein
MHTEKSDRLFPYLKPHQFDSAILPGDTFRQAISEEESQFMVNQSNSLNEYLPAGYTYFGQFVAHELTFPELFNREIKSSGSIPTSGQFYPRLNLYSIYGMGPDISPHLYSSKNFGRTHFQLIRKVIGNKNYYDFNRVNTLDTNPKKHIPLIPDTRNDENIIVSQIHVVWQRLHNCLIEEEINNSPYKEEFRLLEKEKMNINKPNAKFPNNFSFSSHGPKLNFKNTLKSLLNEFESFKLKSIASLKKTIQNIDMSDNETLQKSSTPLDNLNPGNFIYTINAAYNHINEKKINIQQKPKPSTITYKGILFEILNKTNIFFEKIKQAYIVEYDSIFQTVRKKVEWHFQHMIIYDFLLSVLDEDTIRNLLDKNWKRGIHKNGKNDLKLFKWKDHPFLPIEFSTAFFRFGHSMVCPHYRFHIDSDSGEHLFTQKTVFQPLQKKFDWPLFFTSKTKRIDGDFFNRACLIDLNISTELVDSIFREFSGFNGIVQRNLKRSHETKLPSGQDVARYMVLCGAVNYKSLEVHEKEKKKELINSLFSFLPLFGEPNQQSDLKKQAVTHLCNNSPLWFYTLMEAHLCNGGERLGPVASRIIAEVIIGIIEDNPDSFWNSPTPWKPDIEGEQPGVITMADLFRFVEKHEREQHP